MYLVFQTDFTCDPYFNTECILTHNVLYDDCVDACVCALSRSKQKLGSALCVTDGHLFRHR